MSKASKISAIGFFRYLKGYIGNRIYIYILLNFFIGFFDALGLAMFIPLISIATGSINEGSESLGKLQFLVDFINRSGFELNLVTALTVMVLMFILKGIFYYIKLNYLNKTQLIALRKIRFNMVDGLKTLSYEGFTKMDAGKIQNNMVGETGKLMSAITAYFTTVQHVVLLVTYVAMAVASNWKFAIMVAIGGLLTNIFYKYVNKIIKDFATRMVGIAHLFNGNLIQTINHFKYLKATNHLKVYEKRLKENIEVSEKLGYNVGKVSYIAESIREPMIIIVIAAVLFLQVQIMGNNFGSILVSLMLFYRSLGYLVSMQATWSSFLRSSVGVESVETMIEDFSAHSEKPGSEKITKIGTLKVQDVSLSFDGKPILDKVNLTIPAKTSVALVGESGAGKTTLANVACGLFTPHQGKVLADGISVYDSDVNHFREKIGYITQEAVIFDDTVFNNVTFWAPKSPETLKKFNEVMKIVSLENFLNKLERKEDAPLGNNGILISGGQKQRIAIARELFKDCELLIMDEATAALDSETEKHIKDNIDMLHGKFTIIIIAHRLSTIKNVDCIYLMEDGEILDSGPFDELTQKSEKFSRMVELQQVN